MLAVSSNERMLLGKKKMALQHNPPRITASNPQSL
jgi:hypothetical protein